LKVLIEFIGMQRSVTGAPSMEMPISANSMVRNVLEYVKKQYPALPLDGGDMFITVNHEVTGPDRMLHAGDIISFIPAIGGG
jgi:molybdopterin converting factor small subunit